MQTFVQLLAKEFKYRQDSIKLRDGIGILALVALFIAVGPWPRETLLNATVGILILLIFWVVAYGIECLTREWKNGNSQLLLSLPIRGCDILGAKLAIGLMEGLAMVAVGKIILIGGSYYFLDWGSLSTRLAHAGFILDATGLLASAAQLLLFAGLFIICGVALTQFAWVAGALSRRSHIVVGMAAGSVGVWLLLRSAALASSLLSWSPRVEWWMVAQVRHWMPEDELIYHVVAGISPLPLLAMLLPAAALFACASYFLDTQVEA